MFNVYYVHMHINIYNTYYNNIQKLIIVSGISANILERRRAMRSTS